MIVKRLFARLMAPAGDAADLGLGSADMLPAGDVDEDTADFGADHEATDEAPAARRVAPKVRVAKVETTPDPKSLKEAVSELSGEVADPEEADPEPEATDPKKNVRIPLSRHKDLLEKERAKRAAVEQQLAQYQHGTRVAQVNAQLTAQENAIVEMEKKYTTFLADGEIEKATEMMREIRTAEREIIQAKSQMEIAAAQAQATEKARFDVTLDRVEKAYPELDEDHDDFNEKKRDRVSRIMKANRADGMTPADALQDAVEAVMGEPETTAQKTAVEVTARVATPDVTKGRKAEAVEKTVKAVKGTPPSTAKIGIDSDKAGHLGTSKPISKMTDKELAAMTDEQLAAARGDHLETEEA